MLGYVDRHSQVSNESRTKMVRSAVSLIRRRGLSRASFADIVADSGAPRGSIYHHFPQGKDQLAKEAIRATSDWVLAKQGACAAKTPVGVLEGFIDLWRQVVVASNGAAGGGGAGVAGGTHPGAPQRVGGRRRPAACRSSPAPADAPPAPLSSSQSEAFPPSHSKTTRP